MESSAGPSATILLERPDVPAVERCEPGSVEAWWGPPPADLVAGPVRVSSGSGSAFRTSGLALLAAVSVLEGYKWIGAIPVSNSHLSGLLFGRGGALVFAGFAAAAVVALTRPDRGRRPVSHTVVVLAAVMLMAATAVLATSSGTPSRLVVGLSDLTLAVALAGSLAVAERRKRQAEGVAT
jgi:hypothetical protein